MGQLNLNNCLIEWSGALSRSNGITNSRRARGGLHPEPSICGGKFIFIIPSISFCFKNEEHFCGEMASIDKPVHETTRPGLMEPVVGTSPTEQGQEKRIPKTFKKSTKVGMHQINLQVVKEIFMGWVHGFSLSPLLIFIKRYDLLRIGFFVFFMNDTIL